MTPMTPNRNINEFPKKKAITVVDTASFSPKNENKPIIEKTQIEASITPKTDFSKPLILNDSSAVMTDCEKIVSKFFIFPTESAPD